MDKLLEILKRDNPGVAYEGRTDLVTSGDISSLAILMIVADICDEFDVEIMVTDVTPDNFDSVESMYSLIQKLQDED